MSIKERKRTDREYASYIDYKTIGLLFCLMTVMAGLQSLGVFKKAGERLLGDVKGPGGRVCRAGAPDHCGKSGKYADALHSGIPGNAGELPGRSGP